MRSATVTLRLLTIGPNGDKHYTTLMPAGLLGSVAIGKDP